MATVAEKTTRAFQLKGSLFTITALQLLSCDADLFQEQLEQTLGQAPKFFENAPIVIDLNEFENTHGSLHLDLIVNLMRARKLIPFGVRGGDLEAQKQAATMGLAILHNSTQASQIKKTSTKKLDTRAKMAEMSQTTATSSREEKSHATTKVITQPIRSGQQIYANNSDLIVLSSVSHGAEILSDGHIHIYGPLRGRALAGILGNTDARIFCKSLDAELISIAGRYLVSEQLDAYKDMHDLHIYLEEDQIRVTRI